MNWKGYRKVVADFCAAINDGARTTEHRKILAATKARRELSVLLRPLAQIDDASELEQILGIVLLMAEYDLRIAAGQSIYIVSATAAVEQLRDCLAMLAVLREPALYIRAVANTHTAAKYRPDGLPRDQMRRGLRAQLARIKNAIGAMALPEDRVELYISQRALVRQIEKLYIQLQRQVLEIAPAAA